MEISLALHQQLHSSSRFACSSNFCRERLIISGNDFPPRKREYGRSLFPRIKCCLSGKGLLKPRPVPKPCRKDEKFINEETQIEATEMENGNSSAAICRQIEKLVLCRRYHGALDLFEILECDGENNVGSSTYDALINACIGLRSVSGVKRVFNHMKSSGFEPDLYLKNRILLMHVKCGMMVDGRSLFDEMRERNLVSWNIIIGGMLNVGNYMEAFQLFLLMWDKYPNARSRTLNIVIRACSGLELVSAGRQLHSCALKMGLADDVFVSCALIDMYSKCGSIEDARCVFDKMPEKTTVAWNSMIAGYGLHGFSEKALDMYYEMQDSDVKMDNYTFSIIIRVCTRLASLEHAKQAHAGLVRHGFGLDIYANTGLVDFYSKWGRIEDARNIFERMPKKNLEAWNALLSGYGNHGEAIESVELFERMIQEGIRPNHVTFLAVLSACSYSGLLDHGRKIFESMIMQYKMKPRAMHYACMIELLGREGLLDEAFALIRDAPLPPTLNMWAALLRACRVHQNLELGTFVAEKICALGPKRVSDYVVLLNIYQDSGKQQEVAAILETLRRKHVMTLPSSTWIEIKKEPHSFLSGDNCHVQTMEIYAKLSELMLQLSKHGYTPKGKYFLPDVVRQEQRLLLFHSERLAISFGLINTPESTPLQLVQSHRICNDCHHAIKLIAMVTNREIVVRDASRFHHFKSGSCSCGDYW